MKGQGGGHWGMYEAPWGEGLEYHPKAVPPSRLSPDSHSIRSFPGPLKIEWGTCLQGFHSEPPCHGSSISPAVSSLRAKLDPITSPSAAEGLAKTTDWTYGWHPNLSQPALIHLQARLRRRPFKPRLFLLRSGTLLIFIIPLNTETIHGVHQLEHKMRSPPPWLAQEPVLRSSNFWNSKKER